MVNNTDMNEINEFIANSKKLQEAREINMREGMKGLEKAYIAELEKLQMRNLELCGIIDDLKYPDKNKNEN